MKCFYKLFISTNGKVFLGFIELANLDLANINYLLFINYSRNCSKKQDITYMNWNEIPVSQRGRPLVWSENRLWHCRFAKRLLNGNIRRCPSSVKVSYRSLCQENQEMHMNCTFIGSGSGLEPEDTWLIGSDSWVISRVDYSPHFQSTSQKLIDVGENSIIVKQ